MAATLAVALHCSSSDPHAEGVQAGRAWGRGLAQNTAAPPERGEAGVHRQVIALLAGLGFAPVATAQESSVRLTRCPLLGAARSQPDVVCGVHLGIVQGALQAWDQPVTDAELLPFSEPGACRLLLGQHQPTVSIDPMTTTP